jgi:hypothetical protein
LLLCEAKPSGTKPSQSITSVAHLCCSFCRRYQLARLMPSASHGFVALNVLPRSLAKGRRNSRLVSDGLGATPTASILDSTLGPEGASSPARSV